MHVRPPALLALAAGIALAAGCSSMKAGREAADKAIAEFHERLDAGSFAEIYDAASPEFQKAGTRKGCVQYLEAVHRKLGKVRSSTNQGWQVRATTSGTFVAVTQDTTFETGRGIESFRFAVRDGSAVLVGYDINSTDLIVK